MENISVENVSNFDELTSADFNGSVNAFCWQRNPEGDFEEIVSKLRLRENITEVSCEELLRLNLSENGNKARDFILKDLQFLGDFGALPALNLIKNYERDDESDIISTDVYSFHADRSPIGISTFLCTYSGAASDILPNDDAVQKILIPEIREKLMKIHGGETASFEEFLKENYYDLHYQAQPNAKIIILGTGNLWKLAVDHPKQKVLPCIHRAPQEIKGEKRLLLIC